MTSTVAGQAKWQTCWRQACYLSKYIYKFPPGPGGFQTQYPDKMAQVEQNWAMWAEQNDQAGSGLVARLFKLKNWDPATQVPGCPPCLVYRGTDFEDMRGLGISATIRVQWGIVWWTFEFNKVFDPTIPQKRVGKNRGNPAGTPADYTRQELLAKGFTPIPIVNETGRTTIEGATRGTEMNLDLRMQADLMAREDGDWLNNLYQGLGRGSKQYSDAITFGKRCVNQKILPLKDKRLEITGHSLGGGLAAAVCCVLDYTFPAVVFHAMTFNSSGVHANTVRPAALTDAVANNFTVDDEILTTLQSYTSSLPFVGAVFSHASRSLGMKAMPPALGTLRRVPGKSPGGSLGAKGSALPNLFPVASQTLKPGGPSSIPVLSALDAMLLASPTLSQFGTRFVAWLNARYRAEVMRVDNPWTIVGIYQGMFRLLAAELAPEQALVTDLFKHAAEYHGMDVVIATYDSIYGGR